MMERLLFARHQPLRRDHPIADDRLQHDPLALWGALNLWFDEDNDGRIFFDDVTPEIVWPVDESVAVRKEDHVFVCRLRTCSPAEFRGKARLVPRHCAWLISGDYNDDGTVCMQRIPVGWLGRSWMAVDGGLVTSSTKGGGRGGTRSHARLTDPEVTREIADNCRMLLSVALTNRYEWFVRFRIDEGPVVKIATDAVGIKALFKDRELGNRKRRAALRHWVLHHWRQHRTDAAAEIFVREHLRGAEAFRWCGYDCRVEVSSFDLDRHERARRERASMAGGL